MSKPDDRTGVTSPPSGTGHVPGLGEAFRINLNTGQGVYSYKLPLPEGVAGCQPQVTLEYGHGSGLGVFGLGWKLPVRSIARRLDLGVPGAGAAETFLDGSAELVEFPDGTYAPLVDTAFTRYTRVDEGWRVGDRNGVVHDLGLSAAARVGDPADGGRVQEYLLERSTDPNGQEIRYRYRHDQGWSYIEQILYASYAVRFEYEVRPDARRDGRAGWVRTRALRCRQIGLYLDPGAGDRLVRSWTFTYEIDPVSGVSLLAAIGMVSHGAASDGSQDVARAAVRFTYTPFNPAAFAVRLMEAADGPEPPPLSDPETALVTLDQAPLPGILQVSAGRQWYWRNRGNGTWGYPEPVRQSPSIDSFAQTGVALVDADGSGTADLVTVGADPLHGYYENGGDQGWSRFVAYPRGRRSTPDWTSGRIRLTDADGNGVVDALMSSQRAFARWINHGPDGWSEPIFSPREPGAAGEEAFGDPLVWLADLNGDGLDDLVRLRSGRVEYWPGLGHGRFGAPVMMTGSPRVPDLVMDPGRTFLMDVNGDGCADLVHVSPGGIRIHFNRNGSGFSDPVVIDTVPAPIPGSVRAVNMNGQARAGLVWNSMRGRSIGYVQLEFGEAAPASLLAGIDNGSGLRSELTYRWAVDDQLRDFRDGRRWDTNLPFPLTVVAGSRETDLVSGQVTATEYRYHEGHFDRRTRQFQGFRRAERIERGDESRADVLTEFEYLMAEETRPGHGPEHAALNGLQRRTATYSLDGSARQHAPYRLEECTHELTIVGTALDGRKKVFFAVTAYRTEDRERTADLRVEEKTYQYDAFGNVTIERLRGVGTKDGAAMPGRERVTEIEYAASPDRFIVDRPSRVVVRDETGGIISEKRRYYDGPAFVGLPLGQVDRGLVTRDEQLVLSEGEFAAHYAGMDAEALGYQVSTDRDGVASWFVNTDRSAYDTNGLKVADQDALGHRRDYEYDASGLFRTRLRDALGDTTFHYDRATGQPVRAVYQDGAVTEFRLDAQGRILANLLPGDDGANPPRVYSFDDTSVPASRLATYRASAGVTASTATYFDGRGKEFQQRVEVEPGTVTVSGLRVKNPWGDVKREYEPTTAPSLAFSIPDAAGQPHRQVFFDGQGRPVRTVDFGGAESRAEYRPFETLLEDANDTDGSAEALPRGHFNTPKHEEFDVFRHRTRVVDELGGGASVAISYSVSTAGDLLRITDSAGDLCTYRYDRLGRRLAAVHREAGERKLFYDGRGKVMRATDAAGNDLRVELDALGRLTRLHAGAAVLERYEYDDASRNAVGRLAQVTYAGGRQLFRYDTAGRTIEREYQFDGAAESHTVRYEFDALGRETAIVHGDGRRVEYQLTPNGLVRAMPGILTDVRYDSRGLPVRIEYANHVVTELTYTDGPARVVRQRTAKQDGTVLEDSTFTYDAMRMLLAQHDAAPGGQGSRSLEYDPLYQLKRAVLTELGAPVVRDYQYANHWNLSRLDEAGRIFHYDDAAHPDRIAGLTEGAAPRIDLTYDVNGNLLGLPGRTLAYNAKNELGRVTAPGGVVAEYRYDHEGVRVSKTVTTGGASVTTRFIGRGLEIRDGVATHLMYLGAMRVAIVQGATTRFVHSNYLGSTSFFTDAAGTKIAAIAYRPFGNVASSTGVVDLRTYGAHPFDEESGLFYMKRRYYAPEIGRFVSPDPLSLFKPQKFLDRPRALHPYAYGGNDPVNNADPDGLSFWSVVGAIVGVIVGVALAALVVMTGGLAGILIGAGLLIGLMAVSYVVADATAGTAFGEFMRGFMIGVNAGMNAVFATVLFGPVIGIALGVINFLAAVDEVAANPVYQGILGWSSWLMPMSWLATGVGLAVFLINVVVGFFAHTVPNWFGVGGWDQARINSVSVDWGTGTIVMHGGMFTIARGGYNLGNFAYIHRDSAADASLIGHETGHTLNVAAFGSIFHYIGAIDENLVGRFAGAYAEQLADSHDPTRVVADTTVWQEIWV